MVSRIRVCHEREKPRYNMLMSLDNVMDCLEFIEDSHVRMVFGLSVLTARNESEDRVTYRILFLRNS